MGEDEHISVDLLVRWFGLPVEVMKPLSKKEQAKMERSEGGCGYGAQIETTSAHELMKALKPPAPLADHLDALNVTLARCGMCRRRP